MTKHPITPPPELVQHWIAQVWHEGTPVRVAASDLHVATQAARWGADKMLEGEPHGPTNEDLLGLDELRDAWNAQADASNSWDELGMDEIIWFAQQLTLARWGRPAPALVQLEAELPPRPPLATAVDRPDLVRHGVTWDGSPDKPLLTPASDGYWTPWHIAARLPQPIPVSERLPGPEDCDEDCMLWLYTPDIIDPEVGSWTWANVDWVTDRDTDVTHWLPHWAMPLPAGTKED